MSADSDTYKECDPIWFAQGLIWGPSSPSPPPLFPWSDLRKILHAFRPHPFWDGGFHIGETGCVIWRPNLHILSKFESHNRCQNQCEAPHALFDRFPTFLFRSFFPSSSPWAKKCRCVRIIGAAEAAVMAASAVLKRDIKIPPETSQFFRVRFPMH